MDPITRNNVVLGRNTFYGEGTHFMGKEHIVLGRNTFYGKGTHCIEKEQKTSKKQMSLKVNGPDSKKLKFLLFG